jgi:hypothetical protein
MPKPEIIIPDYKGFHNANPNTRARIEKSKSYQDLSTIVITPAFDSIPTKVVQNWMGMIRPMNQKFVHIFAKDMEVGQAYSETIEMILNNPDLSKWKFIATLEHDNLVPPNIWIQLYEDIGDYSAIGSLYYTKGYGGQPMAYGKVDDKTVNFIPFPPPARSVTPCRGLGMGATLFKLEMFKDKRLPRPLFETIQKYTPNKGTEVYTQDLRFFQNAGEKNYKFAVSTNVLTGHYDLNEDKTW